jgi:hypothetical protein
MIERMRVCQWGRRAVRVDGLMWKKISEQCQEKGSYIFYECQNDGCSSYVKGGRRFQEKVFEER